MPNPDTEIRVNGQLINPQLPAVYQPSTSLGVAMEFANNDLGPEASKILGREHFVQQMVERGYSREDVLGFVENALNQMRTQAYYREVQNLADAQARELGLKLRSANPINGSLFLKGFSSGIKR